MGIAENGFRELTNSKHEVKTLDDMKNLKIRVAGSNLLMECYKRWGADATKDGQIGRASCRERV